MQRLGRRGSAAPRAAGPAAGRKVAARYQPERQFKDFPTGPEQITMPYDGGKLRVDQVKEKLSFEQIDNQVWEMKRQLALTRMRKNNPQASEPYRGHEATKIKRQIARMLTARRQLEVADGISARQSRKLRKRRLMEHGLLIRHRKGNLQYKRLRRRRWETFQRLPDDETNVRTRLPGQQPGNTPKPKRPKTRRPPP